MGLATLFRKLGWKRKNKSMSDADAAFSMANAAAELLIRSFNGETRAPINAPDPKAIVGLLFARAYKTFQAFQTLWRSGFEEDAEAIARTIFEIAMQMRYIAKDPVPLSKLYWEHREVTLAKDLRKFKASKSSMLQQIAKNVEQGLPDFAKRSQGFGKSGTYWWGTSIEDLSTKTNLTDMYLLLYSTLSQSVHGTISSTFDLVKGGNLYPHPESITDTSLLGSVRKWIGKVAHDHSQFEHAQIVGCELLVARSDAAIFL